MNTSVSTIALLIRHAVHDSVDRVLVGRSQHVGLSPAGMEQAEALARALIRLPITTVQSSPQLRARQTAEPLARVLGLPLEIATPTDEVDFGHWAGLTFAQLAKQGDWRRWNRERGSATTPGGESMRQVQRRTIDYLDGLRKAHAGRCVAIFSHAEPIRTAVMHARAIPLDDYLAVRIDPGSVSAVRLEEGGWTLLGANATSLVTA